MKNIALVKNCYGCGMCSVSCPQNIITIQLNQNGFYEPRIIAKEKCIECGICTDVCGFLHKELASESCVIKSWAAWSNDELIRRNCSSGGIGFEIGKQLIAEGYKVIGCRYNAKAQRAEHYIASTVEELGQSMGSKYIQSFTVDALRAINRKEKYLFVGTPCQVDSFRRFIKKFHCEDNFVLMDFFCHGIPSMLAWNFYIRIIKRKVGDIIDVLWRDKKTGWHDSWCMSIAGDRQHLNSRKSRGDLFYRLFLGDYCCNPACMKECKYKYNSSSADIRIGDLWGETYRDNEDGVSALVVFTAKGQKVTASLQECVLVEHPFEIVAEGQMKSNVGRALLAPWVMALLRRKHVSLSVMKCVLLFDRILRKLKSMIARKKWKR